MRQPQKAHTVADSYVAQCVRATALSVHSCCRRRPCSHPHRKQMQQLGWARHCHLNCATHVRAPVRCSLRRQTNYRTRQTAFVTTTSNKRMVATRRNGAKASKMTQLGTMNMSRWLSYCRGCHFTHTRTHTPQPDIPSPRGGCS